MFPPFASQAAGLPPALERDSGGAEQRVSEPRPRVQEGRRRWPHGPCLLNFDFEPWVSLLEVFVSFDSSRCGTVLVI